MKILFLFLLCSTFSYAMDDTEAVKKEAAKLSSEASSNIIYKCKCVVSFDIDWSGFPDSIAMKQVTYTLSNFGRAMPSFCADDGIQKACVIKKVKISYGPKTSSSLSGGVADLVTDGKSHLGFDSLVKGND